MLCKNVDKAIMASEVVSIGSIYIVDTATVVLTSGVCMENF